MGLRRRDALNMTELVCYQQGWKIFNIQVAQQVIVGFHIHPSEACLRQMRSELVKQRLVLTAGTAPLRAQAKHMDRMPVGGWR